MSGSSLFGRLERAADPGSSGRSVYRAQDLESVVLEHLSRMLNTRAGSAPTVPDYGVAEISELLHSFPDANGLMQRALKHTVAKYEPRIKNVQVRILEDPESRDALRVRFEITGQIVFPNGNRQALRVTTSVDPSSTVSLS
ncbi:MAG: type VI secretion system baseplate subunit TssE [Myxococcales bacterium]|nr:type VI secretion system baseplate subunit TssE [Myxococcales bacterium]